MTMKEVLDKMHDLASQSLKTLEAVYDFHNNTEVFWWDGDDSDDGWLIKREIDERKHVLSDDYYNLMMEIEKEVNEQFKDINPNISYSLDYDIDPDDDHKYKRTSLSHINIHIDDKWDKFTIAQYYGYDEHKEIHVLVDYFSGIDNNYSSHDPEEDYSKGVKEMVAYWRKVYDEYDPEEDDD